MISQIIFSGHVSQNIDKQVEQDSVERIYGYCHEFGVTGLKLYTDGNFFCILEGHAKAVQSLKNLYQQDDRLSDVVVLLQDTLESPEFDDFKICIRKNDTQIILPQCYTLTADFFEALFPKNISSNAKILVKAFARVSNLIPRSYAA